MNTIYRFALTGALALLTCPAAQAQKGRPAAASMLAAADSLTKVYAYVQYTPLYKGKEDTELLAKDLQREFQTASIKAGCSIPSSPIIVSITVGPSGVIYSVKSVNNMPLISAAEGEAGVQGIVSTVRSLPEIPVACEAALVAAGQKLPRLVPGSLNGRRVAVGYTLRLSNPAK